MRSTTFSKNRRSREPDGCCSKTPKTWIIDTNTQWSQAHDSSTNIVFADGFAEPNQPTASFKSIMKTFPEKKQAKTITFTQSPVWDNWTEIPAITPWYTGGAPVFLPIADKDYWFFAKKDKKYHAWHSTDLKRPVQLFVMHLRGVGQGRLKGGGNRAAVAGLGKPAK